MNGAYGRDPRHQHSVSGDPETPLVRDPYAARNRAGGFYPAGLGRFGTHGETWSPHHLPGRDDPRGFAKSADEPIAWFDIEHARQFGLRDHRGKGPRNYKRSDERLAEDVNQYLTDDVHLDVTEIEVSVSNQEFTLNGYVQTRAAKRRAEDCADAVSGVEHVQNNLRVREPVPSSKTFFT